MTPRLLALRAGLAITALVLFGLGIWYDLPYLRWAGIAFLVAGLGFRFVGRGTPKG